ncbi:hypothetical protein QQF64_007248 [Cirrhinus molitorella]|uniref:Uncharacterized protein n=1 Tax=Cirrhinus molitorella TaxID=172907 RepID=A0ABR3MA67_9TELE
MCWNVCVCVRVNDLECVSVGHRSGIPGLGKLNADPSLPTAGHICWLSSSFSSSAPPASDICNRVFPETKDGRNGGESVGDGGLSLISLAQTISLDTAAEIFGKLPNVLIDRRYSTWWKVGVG